MQTLKIIRKKRKFTKQLKRVWNNPTLMKWK